MLWKEPPFNGNLGQVTDSYLTIGSGEWFGDTEDGRWQNVTHQSNLLTIADEAYLGQGMIIASRKVSVSTLDTDPETNLYDYVILSNIRGRVQYRKSLIEKASRYVKPGGIIIVRGFNLRLQDEHGEPLDDDNPAQKLFKSTLTAEMAERNDLPSDDELIHRQMMKEAGLFIVEGETRLTPVNSWPTETHAKRKGAETEKIIGETLEQLCHGPFVEDGQFDQEILMECVMSRESLKDPNNRFYIGFSTVFGKKPLSG